MDDEESGAKELREAIRELKSMSDNDRTNWLARCKMELRYADGWSSRFYDNYIEASKYV